MDELDGPRPDIRRGGDADAGPSISYGFKLKQGGDILREAYAELMQSVVGRYDGTPIAIEDSAQVASQLFNNVHVAIGDAFVANIVLDTLRANFTALDNEGKVQLLHAAGAYFSNPDPEAIASVRRQIAQIQSFTAADTERTVAHATTAVLNPAFAAQNGEPEPEAIPVREEQGGRTVFNALDLDAFEEEEERPTLLHRITHPFETVQVIREEREIARAEAKREQAELFRQQQQGRLDLGAAMPWLAYLSMKIMPEGQTRFKASEAPGESADEIADSIKERLNEIAAIHPTPSVGAQYSRVLDNFEILHDTMRDNQHPKHQQAYALLLNGFWQQLSKPSKEVYPLDWTLSDLYGNKHIHSVLAGQAPSEQELQFLGEYLDTITIRQTLRAQASEMATVIGAGWGVIATRTGALFQSGMTVIGDLGRVAQARYDTWQFDLAAKREAARIEAEQAEPQETRLQKLSAATAAMVADARERYDAWQVRRAEAKEAALADPKPTRFERMGDAIESFINRIEERLNNWADEHEAAQAAKAARKAAERAEPKEPSIDWEPLRADWRKYVSEPLGRFNQNYVQPYLARLQADTAAIKNHFTSGEWLRSQALVQQQASGDVIALPDLSGEAQEPAERITMRERVAALVSAAGAMWDKRVAQPWKTFRAETLVPLGERIQERWTQFRTPREKAEADPSVIALPDLTEKNDNSLRSRIGKWWSDRQERIANREPRQSSTDWDKVRADRDKIVGGLRNARDKYLTPFMADLKDGWDKLGKGGRTALVGGGSIAVAGATGMAAILMSMSSPQTQATPDLASANNPVPAAAAATPRVAPPASTVTVVQPAAVVAQPAAVAPVRPAIAQRRAAAPVRVAAVRPAPVRTAARVAPTGNMDSVANVVRSLQPETTTVTVNFGNVGGQPLTTVAPVDPSITAPVITDAPTTTTVAPVTTTDAPESLLVDRDGRPLFDFSDAANGDVNSVLDSSADPSAQPLPTSGSDTDSKPQADAGSPDPAAPDATGLQPQGPAVPKR